MSNNSIWPIDRILSGAPTPGQSGPGSDGNEGVLCIPQSTSITVASQSDCSVSYPRYPFGEYYPSAEMQSVYSAAPADWATGHVLGRSHTPLHRCSRCIHLLGFPKLFPWFVLFFYVNFTEQHTMCVCVLSRLKLYLPNHDWTMN